MNDKYKVEILERAVFDIREIYRYILPDNPTAAQKIIDNIYKSIEDLTTFPQKGSHLDRYDNIMSGWKFITVKPYLIFYKIHSKIITVYHVIDGRRDYIKILNSTNK